MISNILLKRRYIAAILSFAALCASPVYAQNGSGDISTGPITLINGQFSPETRANLQSIWKKMRGHHASHTDVNVVAALRSSGKYKTFLALAEKAGLMPLLTDTLRDSTPIDITYGEAISKTRQFTAQSGTVEGGTPPNANVTEMVAQAEDAISDQMREIKKSVAAEEGQITVFAPTDAAFAKVPKATLAAIEKDPVALKNLLCAHIVKRGVYSEGLRDIMSMQSVAGSTLSIGKTHSGAATVNGATIVDGDLSAHNGAAHGIDAVLSGSSSDSTANGSAH